MPKNFNSPAKNLVRSVWCKPLLQFLSETLENKLIYLGLPSENPEDIYEWIEYLDEVYAFQCREYPKPSEENQSRKKVVELEQKLRELETKGQLNYSVVYDGYLEEVLLNGKDNNPQPIEFEQENTITIYNLDFCNQFTAPIKYYKNGEEKTAHKFDAIKELLNFQSKIEETSQKFILFLTINAQYSDEHVTRIVKSNYREYCNSISNLGGLETKSRILKAYIFNIIRNAFSNYNFIPEFLPVIRYNGINDKPMLHFTIIGTHTEQNPGGVVIPQNIEIFLKGKFLVNDIDFFKSQTIENDTFVETNAKNNAVEAFKQTKVYKKHWLKEN